MDENAQKKIKELEELVSYKDSFYAETARAEKKLRAGVCNAITPLVHARGSNSIEYLEERIEEAIRILDDSRSRD